MPSNATRIRWALASTLLLSLGCEPEAAESEAPVASSEQSIFGGQVSWIGANPWHAYVRVFPFPDFCGGAILNDRWILTTATCIQPGTNSVVVGSNIGNGTDGQLHRVIRVYPHPDFVTARQGNDIALLYTETSLDLSGETAEAIGRVTAADELAGVTSAGVSARITGWGVGNHDERLGSAELPIVSNSDAQAYYPNQLITEKMLATSDPSRGWCTADEGGPLTVLKNGTRVLAGLASWADHCWNTQVYTRVSSYEGWIDSMIGKTLFFQSGITHLIGPGPVFSFNVPEGTPALKVFLSAGIAMGHISARAGQEPTETAYDCRVSGTIGSRVCWVDNPVPGTWYARLTGRVTQASLNVVIPGAPEREAREE